ncbi:MULTISPECIES: recombinase-like helix-turn-helix domain-containing protein [unclassified Erwinia]|uniref:recombinase-like helix-turn-helix domain-containing protein n=1 Tax=unclassified Erwinia TaxID=2622719 RepID=UPI0006F54598|nr:MULTISPECIES: recombinase-like helix-turn-helix domain-containing protein [unclassified Erwinia]KQN64619.1 hypothetical protein ASF13_01715 [Erwinia sp. Leaf53]PLV62959.1 hypothetical protein NV64_03670 [Erwinia sp. B116]
MSSDTDFNPYLPGSAQFLPPGEGGNGAIHHPGNYQNIIWQTRQRQPDKFEIALIAALESLFEQGQESVAGLVLALNQQRVFDRSGSAWTEASFCDFLRINGY